MGLPREYACCVGRMAEGGVQGGGLLSKVDSASKLLNIPAKNVDEVLPRLSQHPQLATAMTADAPNDSQA